jgi:hypothetical protein
MPEYFAVPIIPQPPENGQQDEGPHGCIKAIGNASIPDIDIGHVSCVAEADFLPEF